MKDTIQLKMSRELSVLLSIGLLGATIVLTVDGCKSQSPTQIATKTSGAIVISVDTGMKAWATYVGTGHATQSQVDKVKQAYNAYYVAMLADEAALERAVTTTNIVDLTAVNSSTSTAENALLDLLNQYLTNTQ